jgi:hypothetical protein
MERGAGELRNSGLQRVKAVIKRQESIRAEGHNDNLKGQGKHRIG